MISKKFRCFNGIWNTLKHEGNFTGHSWFNYLLLGKWKCIHAGLKKSQGIPDLFTGAERLSFTVRRLTL